ncbi:MAG: DR2241 family protein, partial [Limisphaerales bacterium]
IPEDNIHERLSRKRTEQLILDCVKANFNCIRVWGGGFYPDDDFFELCDQYGLIVWQDHLFACAEYEMTEAFTAEIKESLVLAQVLISRQQAGYELRHVQDRTSPCSDLRAIDFKELRQLVDFTAAGGFRPLKSAPNLRSGWTLLAGNDADLEFALNQLYPNAVADWFAVKKGQPAITHYPAFTARQTGMYRITTMLNDTQAGEVIRACCHKNFCLKQRLWTVEGLPEDPSTEKSVIPCLEPCALLLEFARKGMRIEQEEKITMSLSPSDLASMKAALELGLRQPRTDIREADFGAEKNPRRLQLALEKLNEVANTLVNSSKGE